MALQIFRAKDFGQVSELGIGGAIVYRRVCFCFVFSEECLLPLRQHGGHVEVLFPAAVVVLEQQDVIGNASGFVCRIPFDSLLQTGGPPYWLACRRMFYLPGKVRLIRVPTVRALEEIVRQKSRSFSARQLMRPFHSRTRIRPFARRFIFCKPRGFFPRRIAPVVPTCRLNVSVHLGLNENNSTEWPPGPTKKDALARIYSSQVTMSKDETAGLRIAKPHRCRDVTGALTVNLAVIKNRTCRSKNKVDVPFDIAILVELASPFRIERVLPTQEATVTKDRTVGIN